MSRKKQYDFTGFLFHHGRLAEFRQRCQHSDWGTAEQAIQSGEDGDNTAISCAFTWGGEEIWRELSHKWATGKEKWKT